MFGRRRVCREAARFKGEVVTIVTAAGLGERVHVVELP